MASCLSRWLPFLCVSAFSLLLLPARADLAVKGGSSSDQALAAAVFAKVPACFQTQAAVSVRFLDDAEMNAYLQPGLDSRSASRGLANVIDGVYQEDPVTITLRCPCCETSCLQERLAQTFAHEYGHYVWAHLLSRPDRDGYAKIYAIQARAHHLVTSYAATSLEEGFAEAFSFYVLRTGELTRRDPLSFAYLAGFKDRQAVPDNGNH